LDLDGGETLLEDGKASLETLDPGRVVASSWPAEPVSLE
jgi:hypothetical protein